MLFAIVAVVLSMLPYYKLAQAKLPCRESARGNWYVVLLDVHGHLIEPHWAIDVDDIYQEAFLRCLSRNGYAVQSFSETGNITATRGSQLIANADSFGWSFNGRFVVAYGAPLTL